MSSHHLLPYRASDDEESCADQDFHHHGTEDYHDPEKSTSRRRTQILSRVSFLNIGFAVCNLTVFVFLMLAHHVDQCIHPTSAQSPADHIVRYNSTYFDKYGHLGGNPFSQPPGPELDNAWHGLLRGMNIAVEPEWLDQHNATSVRLADGPGLLVQLGVYHELHCLKKLKRWNYRDHYYSNLPEEDLKEEEIHIEHCLEWLRVAALCRSDVTLTTFQWEGVNGSRLATEYPIPRQCVDSERVLEWSEARAVNITQEGILEHA